MESYGSGKVVHNLAVGNNKNGYSLGASLIGSDKVWNDVAAYNLGVNGNGFICVNCNLSNNWGATEGDPMLIDPSFVGNPFVSNPYIIYSSEPRKKTPHLSDE